MNVLIRIFVIGSVMVMSSFLMAQEKRLTNEQKAKINLHLNEYYEELGLSDRQRPKYIEITRKYGLQMKSLKNGKQSNFTKYRKLKTIKKSKDKEIKALLNTEQFNVYEANENKKNKNNFKRSSF